MKTILHVAIELFFAGVGLFAAYAIVKTIREATQAAWQGDDE